MQAVECLADIRKDGGVSSVVLLFDSEQRGTTTAHAARMTLLIPHSLILHSREILVVERFMGGV
jgi:hypothetical protein